MSTIRILGMSGSLRSGSYNTAALRAAQELAPGNVEFTTADISDIPLYNQEVRDQGVPSSVTRLVQQINMADAVLFATPEYNYSVPGVLKNAIDWVSREQPQPFADKPAAIISASPGMLGGARAQYDLRKIMVFMDVHFINKPEVMITHAAQKFDDTGLLIDDKTREVIAAQIDALCRWTMRLKRGLEI